MTYVMREPCKRCGSTDWAITEKGAQDVVRCASCDAFCYNAPRVETGKAVRTVTTIHNGIKPKKRAEILQRFGARCVLCGATEVLHVAHVLSVVDGLRLGLTDQEINHDANLVSLCDECNLGIGARPIEAVLYVAILRRQIASDE